MAGTEDRIPVSLQAIFLASSKGNEVHKPPTDRSASRVFRRIKKFNLFRTRKRENKPLTTTSDSLNRCPPHLTLDRNQSGNSNTSAITEDSGSISPSVWCTTETVLPCTSGHSEAPTHVSFQCPSSKRKTNIPTMSPMAYVESMTRNRGYSAQTYKVLETGYYNEPTALQRESYGNELISVVKRGDGDTLREMLEAGLSPNPCNSFGESLAHMICRRGNAEALKILLEFGCSVQGCDEQGRTLLHECCWAPKQDFTVIRMILELDSNLVFMADSRAATPLSYLPRKDWGAWLQFLQANKETFWPILPSNESKIPPLCREKPNSYPLPNPTNALNLDLARQVASGHMFARKAKRLNLSVELMDYAETIFGDISESEASSSDSDCTDVHDEALVEI